MTDQISNATLDDLPDDDIDSLFVFRKGHLILTDEGAVVLAARKWKCEWLKLVVYEWLESLKEVEPDTSATLLKLGIFLIQKSKADAGGQFIVEKEIVESEATADALRMTGEWQELAVGRLHHLLADHPGPDGVAYYRLVIPTKEAKLAAARAGGLVGPWLKNSGRILGDDRSPYQLLTRLCIALCEKAQVKESSGELKLVGWFDDAELAKLLRATEQDLWVEIEKLEAAHLISIDALKDFHFVLLNGNPLAGTDN